MPSAEQLPDKLFSTYINLSYSERQVMQLLALMLVPISRTTLTQCLQKVGIRSETDKAFSTQALTPLLEKFVASGLVLVSQNGYQCHLQLLHPLIRQLDEHENNLAHFAAAVRAIIMPQSSVSWRDPYYRSFLHCVQDLRIALYLRDEPDLERLATICINQFPNDYRRHHPFAIICPEPLDQQWLLTQPAGLLSNLLNVLNDRALANMIPSAAFDTLEAFVTTGAEVPIPAMECYFSQLLLRGRIRAAERVLHESGLDRHRELEGWLAVLRGDDDAAINLFDQGIARIKRELGKRKVYFKDIFCLYHMLALVRSGLTHHLKAAVELGELVAKQQEHPQIVAIWLLTNLAQVRLGNNRYKHSLENACNNDYQLGPVSQLIHSLVAHWLSPKIIPMHVQQLNRVIERAGAAGFRWIAAEASLLKHAINPKGKKDIADAEQLFQREQIVSLSGHSVGGNEWERSLKALLALGSGETAQIASAPKQSRLIWLVSGINNSIHIQPIEQKQTTRGWTRGRNAALKRLMEDNAKLDFLSPQDRKIVACIRRERSHGYYSQITYEFDSIKALAALIDHPLVFNANNDEEPLTVAKGAFTLEVLRAGGNLTINLAPVPDNEGSVFFRWEGSSRLALYEPTQEQRRIATIIGDGLTIPEAGEKQISAAISAISPHVTVHSDVSGDDAVAESVEADSRLQVMLRPSGTGLSVELQVRPFGEHGPGFFPGRGGSTVIAEVQGKRQQASRDHKQERERLELLMNSCGALDPQECIEGPWRLDEPEDALEFLEELHGAMNDKPDGFVIQWPEGERLKLRGAASWEKMKLSLRAGKDWFALEGEVAISDEEVLSLQRLMELIGTRKGRFIQLAEGEFVALTEELRRRLDDLQRMMGRHGKEQRFHPLMAPLVEEALVGVAGLKGDKQWKSCLERFRGAAELKPVLPVTLQATLRDYQLEGFDWLSRLAHWGVGACLADDMGLGKTVQALALLINRAPTGPALVLAPTSVCLNWESESQRFAPTLKPRIFGSGNRAKFIDDLQPFDLVICSYTLFQQEAELLTAIRWETVVLDEAQAIKNMTTKRSQAAMQLNAGFRITTTGTPVENRLDELWNLFRFLNPGLLGSHKDFTERFATPIERDQDKKARTLLKRLIRPFILRRTKSNVLEELPPRTDIVRRVELSGEEAAFYEALRRKALEKLQDAGNQSPGERQIRILAEIMRLRRACCNPQLVLPECNISSAKLAAFREIVDELRENGHRALVFSQFVDHLSILRKDLDKDGIIYQYLDGSTPAKVRQESVIAFQSGQGELFLISLKAGGVGLNLTAADYVIHMDPWWNPAVEDQASDRAHRIGQLRPVTVYRLVAANTIEEKIIALHHQKRDLADSLLDGTESAARVSADDLLELLRDAG